MAVYSIRSISRSNQGGMKDSIAGAEALAVL
jgi:hypothetical protein